MKILQELLDLLEFKDVNRNGGGKRGERRVFIKEFWAEHDTIPTDTDFEVGDAAEVVSVNKKTNIVKFRALRKGALDLSPEDQEDPDNMYFGKDEIWVAVADEFYEATKVA